MVAWHVFGKKNKIKIPKAAPKYIHDARKERLGFIHPGFFIATPTATMAVGERESGVSTFEAVFYCDIDWYRNVSMVHTRKSTEAVKNTPPSEDKVTRKVKKNVKIRVVRTALKVHKLHKVILWSRLCRFILNEALQILYSNRIDFRFRMIQVRKVV